MLLTHWLLQSIQTRFSWSDDTLPVRSVAQRHSWESKESICLKGKVKSAQLWPQPLFTSRAGFSHVAESLTLETVLKFVYLLLCVYFRAELNVKTQPDRWYQNMKWTTLGTSVCRITHHSHVDFAWDRTKNYSPTLAVDNLYVLLACHFASNCTQFYTVLILYTFNHDLPCSFSFSLYSVSSCCCNTYISPQGCK